MVVVLNTIGKDFLLSALRLSSFPLNATVDVEQED